MKKANEIVIKKYPSNIEVFAYRDDDNEWEYSGSIMSIMTDSDHIPSAQFIPTIRELWEEAEGCLTLKQCREIKDAICENANARGLSFRFL